MSSDKQDRAAIMARAFLKKREAKLWEKLMDLAVAGDVQAAELVLGYAYGKPITKYQTDGDCGFQGQQFIIMPAGACSPLPKAECSCAKE